MMDVPLTDRELTRAAEETERQGQTLESLWHLCRDHMWREAYRILGSRADSEDALMDAVERLARNMHKFRSLPDADLIALSVIYARHTAIDIYNRKKKGPVPVERVEDTAEAEGPEEAVLSSDLEKAILQLLAKMPLAMRDVLNLSVYYGLSVGEIASALHLSQGTVRTRLSRGRKWLREKLAEKGVEIYG